MRIYLAGIESNSSKVLSDENLKKISNEMNGWKPYILSSFYYIKPDFRYTLPKLGDFLLDSGAYTFAQGRGGITLDWYNYIDRYAEFIVENDIKKFFELDIDRIVGYDEVLKMRNYLEKKAQRQCIPVWHISRGKQAFIDESKDWNYIAIGGYAGNYENVGIKDKYQKMFSWFISTAHKNSAKIHGLGFTSQEGVRKYHFDSVDSTTWMSGQRFGYYFAFNENTKKLDQYRQNGKRMQFNDEIMMSNFNEWIKFQRYADSHL